jgi:hypothetical protein
VKDDDFSRLIPSDFLSNEITKSGLYNKICIELELENLALNTVMAFDELKNIDREASKLNVQNNINNQYDDEGIDDYA